MNAFPWTIFFILLAVGALGSAAVLPYAFSMNPDALAAIKKATTGTDGQPAKKKLPMTMPVLLLISIVQSTVLVAVAAFLGLLAAKQVGLGTPILQAVLEGRPVSGLILEMLPITLLLAVMGGVVMMVLEALYFMPRIPRQLANLDHRTALWKRILACFYGGIDEEILMRLFVMSALAWLVGLVWKDPAGTVALGGLWLANFLASVLFGLGHLPATARLTRLTPMIIARAVLLNGIPGVACGYLYMRYGLEAAILCHFSLDIVIHLISVPVMQRRAASLPAEAAA